FLAGKLDRGGGAERAESLDVQGAIQCGDPPEEGTVAHRGVDPRQAVPGAVDGEVVRAGLAPAVVPAGCVPRRVQVVLHVDDRGEVKRVTATAVDPDDGVMGGVQAVAEGGGGEVGVGGDHLGAGREDPRIVG